MPFKRINNIQIYYEERGKGYPVLLIQGLGYPSGMWFLQTPKLAQRFRTIIFDNRGVGKSEKPDEDYSVALMASDAEGLLRSLGIKKTHVVGVSLGGYIAQELALSQPLLVDRLVLMASSCGGPQYLKLTEAFWDEVATLSNLPSEEIIRRGMALATAANFLQKSPELLMRSLSIRMENFQPLYAFTRQSTAAMNYNSIHRAHLIRQPTLILAGAQDRVMPLALTQELAHKIPHAQLKVFPDAGHLLFLEKAQEVNQAILEFLTSPSPVRGKKG